MKTSKFQWDASALIPEEVTMDFKTLFPESAPEGDLTTTFWELPKQDLTVFVDESVELKVYTPVLEDGKEVIDPETKQPKMDKRPFSDVDKEVSAYLWKWLAKSTRGKRDEAFFKKLPVTVTALNALVDMLTEINHVQEIIATQGNWLVLPIAMKMLAAVDPDSALQPQT